MHKQAAINTAKIVGLSIVCTAIGAGIITFLTLSQIGVLLALAFLAFAIRMVYIQQKAELEVLDRINERRKKYGSN